MKQKTGSKPSIYPDLVVKTRKKTTYLTNSSRDLGWN
jgi:hypothetical protein